jgi:hypothetical protein
MKLRVSFEDGDDGGVDLRCGVEGLSGRRRSWFELRMEFMVMIENGGEVGVEILS